MNLQAVDIHIGDFDQAEFIHAQSGAVSEGQQELVLESMRGFEQCTAFLFGEYGGQGLLILERRESQGIGILTEYAIPVPQSIDGLFEVSLRLSFRGGDVIEVSSDFPDGNEVRHLTEVEGHLSDVAAVVRGERLALLVNGGVFNEFLPGSLKSGHDVIGLTGQGVVI